MAEAVEVLQRGRRVFLRAPRFDDTEEFTSLTRLSTPHFRGFVAPPATAADFAAYIERCGREDFEGLILGRRTDGAIMGAVNLSQIFRGLFLNAYMGYHIGAPFAGQGYMTEGLDLALRHAFRTLKLHRLEANIQPENAASIALVKRVGFRLEGSRPATSRSAGAGAIMSAGRFCGRSGRGGGA